MIDATTLMWGIIFGSIGLGFFVYGKKRSAVVPLVCGLGLMLFPYFISNTLLLVFSGVVLAVIPFVIKV